VLYPSFISTPLLPALLVAAIALACVAWWRGVVAYKHDRPVSLAILSGGLALAIAIAAAVEFWLVRG